MIDRNPDDLAQLRRRGESDRAAMDRARGRVPDANGVMLARVPADAVPEPGPIVLMCEPLDTIDAVEKSGGAAGLTWVSDDAGASLVPIVVLSGVRKPGSVLLARPVAGRWVEEYGGGAGAGSPCQATNFSPTSLVASVLHGVNAGKWLGSGVTRRCVSKLITEQITLNRIERTPFNPDAMANLPGSLTTVGPGSLYAGPIAWPQPPEAGTVIPVIVRSYLQKYIPSMGAYQEFQTPDPTYLYGYGSTNGVYYVSEPRTLESFGGPSECYPPNLCTKYQANGWYTLVVCCLPLTSTVSAPVLLVINTALEPEMIDGLPQLDMRNTGRPFGQMIDAMPYTYVYGGGPVTPEQITCYVPGGAPGSPGGGFGLPGLPPGWFGGTGPIGNEPPRRPVQLSGSFLPTSELSGSWRGGTDCGDGCSGSLFSGIRQINIGTATEPPPTDLTDVTILVCGCQCGDDCCPVEGATVRYRNGIDDVTGTTGVDGRVTFAGLAFTQNGNATVDLTPPVGLTRFTAVTRYVALGGGLRKVNLALATGYVCIGAFTPIPRYFVYTGSIVDTYAFVVPNCGFTILPDGTRRTIVTGEACGGFGSDTYELTLNVGPCAGTGDSWSLKRTASSGTVTTTSGGEWSLETAVLDLLTEGVTEWPCGSGGRPAPMMMAMPPGDGEGESLAAAAVQSEPSDADRAKVESCPHREAYAPDDPACWCPRWRCNAGRYSRAWMKPTDGVYVSDCIACLGSGGPHPTS